MTIRVLARVAVALLAGLAGSTFGSLSARDAALLVAPQELPAGGRSTVTVTTFDSKSHRAIARPVAVLLVRDGDVVATLFAGATGETGHVRVPFDVPSLPSGSYSVQARVAGVSEPLALDVSLTRAPAILIETDKPIYKPGQTIQGRVILLDNALRPVAGQVELSIQDAKSIRVDRRELEVGEYGAAPFSLDLASEVNYGVWKIRARSEDVESERDVRVEEYTLPRFDLSLDLPRAWALVDAPVAGSVKADYFFGEPVEGHASIRASRWVGDWEEYARFEGELSGGRLEFTLPAVGFVAGTPGREGQGTVQLEYEVEDSTGYRQEGTEVLEITQAAIVVGLIPRSRALKPKIPFDVLVTARDPDGAPLDAEVDVSVQYFAPWGEVVAEEGALVSVRGGQGEGRFTPPEDAFYAELTGHANRDGHSTTTTARLDGSWSSGSSFLALFRQGDDAPVPAGGRVEFTTASTHPGTVYYEVYAGGRTVFSSTADGSSFGVTVTPDMAPRAKVVAYQIQPDNEVAADSQEFRVDLASTITVEAQFDPDRVRPGDPVQVTLDASTGARALLGVSVVDRSVLALGQSRLHLADVFAELERRFLEPKAEVHPGGGGPGPVPGPVPEFGLGRPMAGGFFGPPRANGALDTIRAVGLDMASSEGVSVPQGRELWDFFAEDAAGGEPPVPAADPGGRNDVPLPGPSAVRVRQFFPETWVWEPLLLTDEVGRATLDLTAPDNITSWQLSAVSTGPEGIGFGEAELTVFQEFFIEPELPYSVTRGEEFPVRVAVFNYLDTEQSVALKFGDAAWYELLGEGTTSVLVPASSAVSVEFPIRPVELGEHSVEITAMGSSRADAVRRTIIVEPEGRPRDVVANGVLQAGDSTPIDVSFPPQTVPGSARATLHVAPSPVAQTMNGLSDLLGMPYGCGEQNMIYLAPDTEILKYLREVGDVSPEIRAQAEYFVNVGYQRELTFTTDDGGFAAFGGAEGSLWLTSFVLSTFAGAREVRDIDEAVLARAAGMLLSRQNADGSFRTDDFLIHKEMDGGLTGAYAMAAYVTNALADYAAGGSPSGEVVQALGRAAQYLRDARTRAWDDAYSLAIAAVALEKVASFEDVAEEIVDRLLELAIEEGPGIHWEPYPVETTGYATLALLGAAGGAGRPEAGSAIDWLSTQRNALGGYGGSTQDTVVAIRALFVAARKVHRDLDLTLELARGEETIWSLRVDDSNFDVLHSTPLPLDPAPDAAALELRARGQGSVGYQIARHYNEPPGDLPPPRDMVIEVDYRTGGIEVDDILDVVVRVAYTGLEARTGMVIADIGIPTGFALVAASTEALVEAEVVSRVETAGRKVIFYIDSLASGEPLEFSFQLRALYPVRAEGPLSRVYEYYDPGTEAYQRMKGIVVGAGELEPGIFVRGDANRDGKIDLSDPIAVLTYLFLGEGRGRLPCLDAGDGNDDGALNITDPIYVLQFLFLGGPAPALPFPEPGEDPSEDALDCLGSA